MPRSRPEAGRGQAGTRTIHDIRDGFQEFPLPRPFEGLEFGARSCDEQTDAE
ncbi:hypothetical protein [Streptomyces sp. NPDC001056]